MSNPEVNAARLLMVVAGILFMVSCSPANRGAEVVANITIYYLPWYSTTTAPLKCGDLVTSDTPTIPQKITISDSAEIRQWVQVLDTISLEEWVGSFTGDCRICCIFSSRAGTELRSMALWPTGVAINDRVYEKNENLIALIRPHMPAGYFRR